jgi:phosphopantothenoylcysteine decarboxylase/phosphopantothenate--cysteine ligase
MKTNRGSLKDKNLLFGITGSVAAYRSIDLIRRLKEQGASVRVVMTDASKRFVTPLSLQIASEENVYSGIFDDPMAHVSLSREADLMLVAPATANTIGKFASGIADDLLSACFLSFSGKMIIAPAMNWRMYENPIVRGNIDVLQEHDVMEIPPQKGRLACGEQGIGRMADVQTILDAVRSALAEKDLKGMKVVVTAGPTREHMDSVRFISNMSTGKMGYAIAGAAERRGAGVVLISGPSFLAPPAGVGFVPVQSAVEMKDAVFKEIKNADVLIMAAAVSDVMPLSRSAAKPDKTSIKGSLKVRATPDILAEVGSKKKRPMLVGFAAEAGGDTGRAKKKLLRKGADIMVFNDITEPGSGFEVDTNKVVIIDKNGNTEYPLLSKEEVADIILDRVLSRSA